MKVFWSWQSDHPGKISRHFVRNALEQAISDLKLEPAIEEPLREAQLDHDRKGVPGSPDLARTIFEKIGASAVFVADVTPVGVSSSDSDKRLINSNVGIELGYALGTISDRALIMVMNEHFGSREDLPFDLRHKAGPVLYRLAPEASKEEIESQTKEFVGRLKVELRQMAQTTTESPDAPFEPVSSISDDPSRYFQPGEILVDQKDSFGDWQLSGPDGPLLYFRLMPLKKTHALKRAETVKLVSHAGGPLNHRANSEVGNPNQFGAICYDANYDKKRITTAVQLFQNREIWAFDAKFVRPMDGFRLGLPTEAVEECFQKALTKYVNFAVNALGLEFPLAIEAGAFGIKDYGIYMPSSYIDNLWGPILVNHVKWSGLISSGETDELERVLLGIYEAFFDAAGVERPKGLFGFPPPQDDT